MFHTHSKFNSFNKFADVSQTIMDIPLVIDDQPDAFIWNEEWNGLYTVHSGYRFFMRGSLKEERCLTPGDWGSLWGAQVPSKVRNLIWRICRLCSPTRDKLQDRHVPCLTNCGLCDLSVETEMHLIFECQISIEC